MRAYLYLLNKGKIRISSELVSTLKENSSELGYMQQSWVSFSRMC